MPIQRRSTPPTSQIKEQHTVLTSLSAWTDNADMEEDDGVKKTKGYVNPNNGEMTFGQKVKAWLDPETDQFNMCVGSVIFLNAIVIGLETQFPAPHAGEADPYPGLQLVFKIFENLFNTFFFIEMVLRMAKWGIKGYFSEPWHIFDFSLVTIGTLDLWILPIVKSTQGATHQRGHVGYHFSVMRLLRIVRLFRVLRVIRLFRMFNQLYLIMQAFYKAANIVALIGLLVFILDYVCAIILTQSIGQADYWTGKDKEKVDEWFGNIWRTMQTLFLIMTLTIPDDFTAILTKVIPAWVVGISMAAYIMITAYTMVSLITGIISQDLVTSTQEYRRRKLESMEGKRKVVANDLTNFLNEMHEDEKDKYGCVDYEDLKTSVRGDTELLTKLATVGSLIDEKGLLAFIDGLSQDGRVRVNIDYFVDKLTHLNGHAASSAIADLKYEVSKAQMKIVALDKKLHPQTGELLSTKDEGPKVTAEKIEQRRSSQKDNNTGSSAASAQNQQFKKAKSGTKTSFA